MCVKRHQRSAYCKLKNNHSENNITQQLEVYSFNEIIINSNEE